MVRPYGIFVSIFQLCVVITCCVMNSNKQKIIVKNELKHGSPNLIFKDDYESTKVLRA